MLSKIVSDFQIIKINKLKIGRKLWTNIRNELFASNPLQRQVFGDKLTGAYKLIRG